MEKYYVKIIFCLITICYWQMFCLRNILLQKIFYYEFVWIAKEYLPLDRIINIVGVLAPKQSNNKNRADGGKFMQVQNPARTINIATRPSALILNVSWMSSHTSIKILQGQSSFTIQQPGTKNKCIKCNH